MTAHIKSESLDTFARGTAASRVTAQASADITLEIHADISNLEYEWRGFEMEAGCTVFQTYDWLAKWQTHVGARNGIRPIIVIGRTANGETLFLLPLAVQTRGLLRCLTFLGSDLCDYNAPLLAREFERHGGIGLFPVLWKEIVKRIAKDLRLRFDYADLGKMPAMLDGQPNPFLQLNRLDHPCAAHVSSLGENWEQYYTQKRSSATRKKERRKHKQLSQYGAVQFADLQDTAERQAAMDILIEQKKRSFARMGVRDLFARRGYAEFFRAVACDPGMREVVHVSRLDVGETVAAANLGLKFRSCYYLVLSSYYDGEMSRFGPGRVHLHELLRYAIGRGFKWFDFTVGDELYKRDWSDTELKLYDHLGAATWRGHIAVGAIAGYRRTKRFIKRTPALWAAYSKARAFAGRVRRGAPAAVAVEE